MTKQVNLAEYMAFIKSEISNIYVQEDKGAYNWLDAYISYTYKPMYIPRIESKRYSESILIDTLDNKLLISLEM